MDVRVQSVYAMCLNRNSNEQLSSVISDEIKVNCAKENNKVFKVPFRCSYYFMFKRFTCIDKQSVQNYKSSVKMFILNI